MQMGKKEIFGDMQSGDDIVDMIRVKKREKHFREGNNTIKGRKRKKVKEREKE